jgi:large subunit ribosomal protein L25
MGRKNYVLRHEGRIPAVVYGSGTEPMNIEVVHNEFAKAFRTAGESSLVELSIDGAESLHVLIQDAQTDPLRGEYIHADFRAVDMTKKIEAEVKLAFVGDSPAVKGLGGTLMHPMDEIRIRALPKDLMSHIDVDISRLATFDDQILVKDLVVPAGVEVLEDMDATVALVAAPRSEEELAELDKAVEIDVTAVEKVEKPKKEGEEEGEANVEEAAK